MKRVLLIINSPIDKTLGASQMAINLSETLKLNNLDCSLLVLKEFKIPFLKYSRIFFAISATIQVIRNLKQRSNFDIIEVPNGLGLSNLFIKNYTNKLVVRSVQPQIQYEFYDLFSISFSLKKNIYKIIDFINLFETFFLSLIDWFYANDILLLGSKEYIWMNKYCPFFRRKYNFYYNTINDSESEHLLKIQRKKPQKKINVLWIGRWVSIKGIKLLISIIRYNKNTNISFTVAGTGFVPQKIRNIFLNYNVNHLPFFERSDLVNLLSKSDVGIFTSKNEGWGLVLNERLESGLFVFATDCGGVRDLKKIFSDQIFDINKFVSCESLLYEIGIKKKYYTWQQIYDNQLRSIYS